MIPAYCLSSNPYSFLCMHAHPDLGLPACPHGCVPGKQGSGAAPKLVDAPVDSLPPLPYPEDALEPHIDSKTMNVHYSRFVTVSPPPLLLGSSTCTFCNLKHVQHWAGDCVLSLAAQLSVHCAACRHHKTYVANLKGALEQAPDLAGMDLNELQRAVGTSTVPPALAGKVRNNGGVRAQQLTRTLAGRQPAAEHASAQCDVPCTHAAGMGLEGDLLGNQAQSITYSSIY